MLAHSSNDFLTPSALDEYVNQILWQSNLKYKINNRVEPDKRLMGMVITMNWR